MHKPSLDPARTPAARPRAAGRRRSLDALRGLAAAVALAGPATAAAQAPEGPAPASPVLPPETGPQRQVPADSPQAARCQDRRDVPWIRRCRPERNTFELGVYGGVFFTGGRSHELFDPVRQLDSLRDGDPSSEWYKPYRAAAPEVGARLAFYPLRFLGGEVEGGAMPTRIVVAGEPADRAVLFNFRAHVVAQLPFWRVAPFILVGGGALGTTGALGTDIDESTHFGAGVKLFLSHRAVLRLDLRNVVAARRRVDAGATSYPEILLGVSTVLGRSGPRKPPAKDSDGDGFLDAADTCPFEPGIEPDGCPPRDRDGDGFMDVEDACPDEPGVAPDGCPARDRDGDGFLDAVDRCPDVPGVEPDGCPIPDTDGDGILDDVDRCPTERESVNGHEDADGCADEVPAPVGNFVGVVRGIYFDLDKDTIKPRSRPVLDRAVQVFTQFPAIRFEISGHTDSSGGVEYNRALSLRRADAVRRYLVDHGIDGARITTRGAGPDEPLESNRTAAGRAKNRRIEFMILVQ